MYFIHLLLNILFVTLSSGYLLSQAHHLNVEKLFFNRKKIWKLFEIKIRLWSLLCQWQKTKIILLLHNLKWYITIFKKNYPYPWKLLAKSLNCSDQPHISIWRVVRTYTHTEHWRCADYRTHTHTRTASISQKTKFCKKKISINGQRTVWLTVWVWTFLSFECSLWSALEHWRCADYPKENTTIYDPFVLN